MRESDLRARLARLAALVAAPNDLPFDHWLRLYQRAIAVRPDLLLEVGRGFGNSTVVLTEAAHALRARVVSVGFDDPPAFESTTWPKLAPVVGDGWRTPLTVIQADVRDYVPPSCERCFLFWDAHGPEVADAMLGRLIPALPTGSTVVVHDVPTLAEATSSPLPLSDYPYHWRDLVSAFEELPALGAWLDQHGVVYEQDTFMLAFVSERRRRGLRRILARRGDRSTG
jgi:hypothetical protein